MVKIWTSTIVGDERVYPVPNVEKEWNDNAGDTHHSPPLF